MEAPITVRLGFLEIFLPDASDPTFWFMEDLASRFCVGFQHEASARLQKAWRALKPSPGRCSIDHEADFTFVHAHKPEVILRVATLAHELAGVAVEDRIVAEALEHLRAWKRPRRYRWQLGDVFALPLADDSIAYGQIVGTHLVKSPSTLLFEHRHTGEVLSVPDIVALPIITILHTDGSYLASGRWRVLGSSDPTLDADAGPWGGGGTSTADSAIEYLANAWFGLIPWNVLATERWLDEQLLPGRARPATAMVLSPEDRDRYREQQLKLRSKSGAG